MKNERQAFALFVVGLLLFAGYAVVQVHARTRAQIERIR